MKRWLMLAARLVVGGIFLYAGFEKILDPAGFAKGVGHYQMLPYALTHLFAIVLPWIELIVGLFLILGIWVRASALVTTLLMLMFLVAVAQAIGRGLDVRCGCFGTNGGREVGVTLLLEDAAMLLVAFWIWWRTPKEDSPA